MAVGEDILPVLGIELVEGRDFSQKFLTDIGQSIMVNQTLVDQMGWGDQAIGK
jgi:putative ABC transport system permease protein